MSKIYERDIKKQILQYMRYSGILCWNNRNTGLYDTRRNKFIPAVMKGISDIIGVMKGGRAIFVEVKTPTNKPTFAQTVFLEQVRNQGAIGIVTYGLEDFLEKLKEVK